LTCSLRFLLKFLKIIYFKVTKVLYLFRPKFFRVGFDSQGMKELLQSDSCNLFKGPDVLSQETGEARESGAKRDK